MKDSGLRYVFVTASPVLTHEVRRFYSELKEQLINYLKAKETTTSRKKLEREKKLKEEAKMNQNDDGSDESFEIENED